MQDRAPSDSSASSSKSDSTAPARAWLTLGLILVVAAVLRFWGTTFGLPGHYRPDEEYLIGTAKRVLAGEFNPGFFLYPSLYSYVLGGVFVVFRSFGEWCGFFGAEGFDVFVARGDDSLLYFIGRLTSASLGTFGVLAIYSFGKRLFGREVGLLSSVLAALSFVHIRESHYATTDSLMTLLVTLSLSALVAITQRGRTRDYAWASLFCGLAISAKYTAAALVVPYALAHLGRLVRERRPPWSTRTVLQCLLGSLVVLATFSATSPYFFVEWEVVKQQFAYQRPFITGGLPGVDMDYGLAWLFGFALRYGVGMGLMILAALGMGVAIWRARFEGRRDLSPLAAIGLLVTLGWTFSSSRWIFLRYIDPFVPVLCVFAALSAVVLGRAVSSRAAGLVACVAVLAVSADPLGRAVDLNRLLSRVDTREILRAWREHQLGTREEIVIHSDFYYGKPGPHYGRYVLWTNFGPERRRESFPLVIDAHPIRYYCPFPQPEVAEIVARRGRLLVDIDPFVAGSPAVDVYDQLDAFFAPVDGFAAVRSPGPRLRLYRVLPRIGE